MKKHLVSYFRYKQQCFQTYIVYGYISAFNYVLVSGKQLQGGRPGSTSRLISCWRRSTAVDVSMLTAPWAWKARPLQLTSTSWMHAGFLKALPWRKHFQEALPGHTFRKHFQEPQMFAIKTLCWENVSTRRPAHCKCFYFFRLSGPKDSHENLFGFEKVCASHRLRVCLRLRSSCACKWA